MKKYKRVLNQRLVIRPYYSLNKKSPTAYFYDIINSNKSEFFQIGMTYTHWGVFNVLSIFEFLAQSTYKK
jgi:hypothetical protein